MSSMNFLPGATIDSCKAIPLVTDPGLSENQHSAIRALNQDLFVDTSHAKIDWPKSKKVVSNGHIKMLSILTEKAEKEETPSYPQSALIRSQIS